jgi:hypothetical protein
MHLYATTTGKRKVEGVSAAAITARSPLYAAPFDSSHKINLFMCQMQSCDQQDCTLHTQNHQSADRRCSSHVKAILTPCNISATRRRWMQRWALVQRGGIWRIRATALKPSMLHILFSHQPHTQVVCSPGVSVGPVVTKQLNARGLQRCQSLTNKE